MLSDKLWQVRSDKSENWLKVTSGKKWHVTKDIGDKKWQVTKIYKWQ